MGRIDVTTVAFVRRHVEEAQQSRKLREQVDRELERLQRANERLTTATEHYRERMEGGKATQ